VLCRGKKATGLLCFAVLIVGFLIGVGAVPAGATTAYRSVQSLGVFNGQVYRAQSWATAGAEAAGAAVWVTGGIVPVAWMGIKPALFLADGTLCASRAASYNAFAAARLEQSVSAACGAGEYYSEPLYYRWDGSQYSVRLGLRSPTVNR
jgi:hypothetical protein